jgi:hypothetical protein
MVDATFILLLPAACRLQDRLAYGFFFYRNDSVGKRRERCRYQAYPYFQGEISRIHDHDQPASRVPHQCLNARLQGNLLWCSHTEQVQHSQLHVTAVCIYGDLVPASAGTGS